MSGATRFLFGTDFREGSRRAASETELAAARAEGFRAGEEQARRAADGQANAMVAQLARAAERLLSQEAARGAAIEEQAVELALTAARALAGAALEEKPLARIEQALRECLRHARTAPHLVLRVNEAALEQAEALIGRLSREGGFGGRVVVLGEPDIAPGDGRIEWADGGFVIDTHRLSELVDEAVAGVFGPGAPRGPSH